jgi:glycosyltransferase involved in cell wall biosynthesis
LKKGFSIIVCCYNSADVIEDTLRSLCHLGTHESFGIEIILVDNSSSDNTPQISEKFLTENNCRFSYRIVKETKQGLTFARERGFRESSYDYIILCDDDNRLNPDYALNAFGIFESNEMVAVAGGYGNAVSSVQFPSWFEGYKKSYSAGAQSAAGGIISASDGYIWGAGMILRKSALESLYSDGFRSLLSDRSGNTLSSGGDVELSYALRLHGYKLCYEPSIEFDHFIKPQRLTWKYLRSLYRGFGMQKPLLEPYLAQLNGGKTNSSMNWRSESALMLKRLRGYGLSKLRSFPGLAEGNADILRIEKTIGRIKQLVNMKQDYDANFERIGSAVWNKCKAEISNKP